MKKNLFRCEICDGFDCNCFCKCGLNHNECVCDFTPKDWEEYGLHKVYIVRSYNYGDGYMIDCGFDTEEKAKKYIFELKKVPFEEYDYIELIIK